MAKKMNDKKMSNMRHQPGTEKGMMMCGDESSCDCAMMDNENDEPKGKKKK